MKIRGLFGQLKLFRRTHDPLWQLQLGIVGIMVLQLLTDNSFLPYSKWWLLGVEAFLMIALGFFTSDGYSKISKLRRSIAMVLLAIAAVVNIFSLIFLMSLLFADSQLSLTGGALLFNVFTVYVTNIFVFALWYWEMDGGGPDRRVALQRRRDFVFPQMIYSGIDAGGWRPGYVDYLYLSTTNVTNFASADTMPLTHRAKLLMMIQALVSVAIVVLVVARSIGLL